MLSIHAKKGFTAEHVAYVADYPGEQPDQRHAQQRRPGAGTVPNASRNYLVAWIRTFSGNLGVDPIRFIFADGMADVRNGRICALGE
ncbi:MAG: hypothetical protein ACYCXP_00645 [Leptospirillum sp.]